MRLDARNRTWRNKATAKMARAFDEAGMGYEVEEIIRASTRGGDSPEWMHESLTQFLYARVCEAYRDISEGADPLEDALICDPELELHISFSEIAHAYIEEYGKSKRTKPKTPKGKASNNGRPKAKAKKPAKAKTIVRRCR